MLDKRYISEKPLIKIYKLKQAIENVTSSDNKELFMFALKSILISVSNIKYGPGFGIGKIKDDADVITFFNDKAIMMISDLQGLTKKQVSTKSKTLLGDSRELSKAVASSSVSLIITSPPYPGDHEYTKHSRVELIFSGIATDIASFRDIKKGC